MKQFFRSLIVSVLARQVRSLRKRHQFKIVGVVGSVGKTSTKLAIAQTLGKSLRVRHQDGNYNVLLSVPLVLFGHAIPSLANPLAWLKIFVNNFRQIYGSYPYDVVVVEIGTDGPGQIIEFKKYLELDIAVVTAVAAEHMEYFKDMKAVADEELSVAGFSRQVIYNSDMVAPEYRSALPEGSLSFSLKATDADYYLSNMFSGTGGIEADVKHGGEIYLHIAQDVVSETQLYASLAAVIVGRQLGLKNTQILDGLASVAPVSGRLRRLRGIKDSTIIDDTYNASPESVRAGLEAIYKIEAPQRIAILGNMNELGSISADTHRQVGEMCDPSKLQLVVTIGPDANSHLAKAAENRGCQVKTFDSPYEAGDFLQDKVESGALVYAKGSQNGVFAEEAVKKLLADPQDAVKLVRQSEYWLKRKAASFKLKS